MKIIPLTQGQFTIVDDDVFEWASKFKWCALKRRHTFYAVRTARMPDGKKRTFSLHREILNALPGVEVDHKDGNGLNNRLKNLRLSSRAENCHNSRRPRNNTSGYVGVYFHRRARKFAAQIMAGGFHKYLGLFDTPIEAAHARDAAAIEFHGKFAWLNFSR